MRFILVGAFLSASIATGCTAQANYSLCPDLTQVGEGNKAVEEARRCVRVMAARYSVSGEAPNDVATAAIDFCGDLMIVPIVDDVDNVVMRQKLLDEIKSDMRAKAIRTVVEMRTSKCIDKPDLFDGIGDPIERPGD